MMAGSLITPAARNAAGESIEKAGILTLRAPSTICLPRVPSA
jgi:hypothetical protein